VDALAIGHTSKIDKHIDSQFAELSNRLHAAHAAAEMPIRRLTPS
jgi:hypothetical protein